MVGFCSAPMRRRRFSCERERGFILGAEGVPVGTADEDSASLTFGGLDAVECAL